MFDWERFFKQNRIDYVERGANVSQGNLNIRCPWCGQADESHHLGVSLSGRGWGCWRQKAHRGRKPHRLIQALTGCTYAEAEAMIGEDLVQLEPDAGFGARIASLLGPTQAPNSARPRLEFLPHMRPISRVGFGSLFLNYLKDRDYTTEEALWLAKTYGLRYTTMGAFRYRIIIPVMMPDGLATWTGRTVQASELIRYKTLSANPKKAEEQNLPVARLSITDTLWNYADLLEHPGHTLVAGEGPFDGMRLDFLGRPEIRGTALFGKNLSEAQVALLDRLAPRYERRVILLDADASLDLLSVQSRLEYLKFEFIRLPKSIKDPAMIQQRDLRALFA